MYTQCAGQNDCEYLLADPFEEMRKRDRPQLPGPTRAHAESHAHPGPASFLHTAYAEERIAYGTILYTPSTKMNADRKK